MKKAIMAILLALAIVLLTPVLARRLSEWRQAAQESAPVERQEPLFTQRTQSASDELEVTLYYRYGETTVLGMERHTLDLRREETIARSIVEQLVAGPDGAHGRLSGVFPSDTQVLSVTTEGSTVFVTLSENFLGRPDGAPEDWEDVAVWQTEATLRRWLAAREKSFRDRVKVVSMDGFAGYHTATTEQLPKARKVKDRQTVRKSSSC